MRVVRGRVIDVYEEPSPPPFRREESGRQVTRAHGATRTEERAGPGPERPRGRRLLNAGGAGGPMKEVFEESVVERAKDEKPGQRCRSPSCSFEGRG